MNAVGAIPGQKFRLSLDEVEPILSLIEAENEWLRQEFGEVLYETSEQFEAGPRKWKPLELVQIAQAAGQLPEEICA